MKMKQVKKIRNKILSIREDFIYGRRWLVRAKVETVIDGFKNIPYHLGITNTQYGWYTAQLNYKHGKCNSSSVTFRGTNKMAERLSYIGFEVFKD